MKRFDIITEADARMLDIGSTVELAAGGHRDAARQRHAGGAAGHRRCRRCVAIAQLPADLAPVARHPPRGDRQRSHRRRAQARARAAPAGTRAGGHRRRHRRHRPGRLSGHRRRGRRSRWRARKPTPASSSTAPASARRSPPTRSAASARRCAWTRRWPATRASTTAPTSSRSARRCCRAPTPRMRIVDLWLGTPMREARYIRRLLEDPPAGRAAA